MSNATATRRELELRPNFEEEAHAYHSKHTHTEFATWLRKFTEDDTPLGELANAAFADMTWDGALESLASKIVMLSGKQSPAFVTLEEATSQYQSHHMAERGWRPETPPELHWCPYGDDNEVAISSDSGDDGSPSAGQGQNQGMR